MNDMLFGLLLVLLGIGLVLIGLAVMGHARAQEAQFEALLLLDAAVRRLS